MHYKYTPDQVAEMTPVMQMILYAVVIRDRADRNTLTFATQAEYDAWLKARGK